MKLSSETKSNFNLSHFIKTRNGSFPLPRLSHLFHSKARRERKTFAILNYRKSQFKIICCCFAMNILGGGDREKFSPRVKLFHRQFILIDCQSMQRKFDNDKTFPEGEEETCEASVSTAMRGSAFE